MKHLKPLHFATLALSLFLFGSGAGTAVAQDLQFSLSKEIATSMGKEPMLKKWALSELKKMKQASKNEKDPKDGKLIAWKGVLLLSLIEESLKGLSADVKAQVDLVVLHGKNGFQALIPRAFTAKYPILMALDRSGGLGELGPIYSVMPWTSNEKIKNEAAPVQSFFVSGVQEVEFSNYRKLFGRFYLQKRTDPAAMRGEKLFVQNCITCHGAAQVTGQTLLVGKGDKIVPPLDSIAVPERIGRLMKQGHPDFPGSPKLKEKEIRALTSYLDAHRLENGHGPMSQVSSL